MATINTRTQPLDRHEIETFVPRGNFRTIKAFENLFDDVSSTIPLAIEQSVQGPSGGSVDDNVVVFDGTSGYRVKDSGVSIDDLAPLESPAFTGTPTAPTALPGTSTTQIATTEFVDNATGASVIGPASSTDDAIALFNGPTGKLIQDSGVLLSSLATTAFVGAAIAPLAPLASPVFTGNPTAPTPSPGDNDTSIATTAFVQAAITANQASFSAHNNGVAQSIPNAAHTKLTFSTEAFDIGSKFAASTWTPSAGIVMLDGAVSLPCTAGSNTIVSVFKNGVAYKRGAQLLGSAAGNQVATVSCIDNANGTDTYELFAFQDTGVAQNTNGAAIVTYFQGTSIKT